MAKARDMLFATESDAYEYAEMHNISNFITKQRMVEIKKGSRSETTPF